jgi:hypothetical protein
MDDYVFTSRPETGEEYTKRTGAAPPAAGSAGPQPRLFRIVAGFAEHDEKFGSTAVAEVARTTAPTRADAEQLIWPAIRAQTANALGAGDWRPSMNWLDVIELLAGPPGRS